VHSNSNNVPPLADGPDQFEIQNSNVVPLLVAVVAVVAFGSLERGGHPLDGFLPHALLMFFIEVRIFQYGLWCTVAIDSIQYVRSLVQYEYHHFATVFSKQWKHM